MKTVWGAPEAEFETKSPVVVLNRSYDRRHVKRKNQAGVEDVGCWLRALLASKTFTLDHTGRTGKLFFGGLASRIKKADVNSAQEKIINETL